MLYSDFEVDMRTGIRDSLKRIGNLTTGNNKAGNIESYLNGLTF